MHYFNTNWGAARKNGTALKYTPAQYDAAAKRHGGIVIEYPRVRREYGWFQCNAGHVFKRSGIAIMETESWCPECLHRRGVEVVPVGGKVKLFDLLEIDDEEVPSENLAIY